MNILVIGEGCEDVYHYGFCPRLSPEAPIPILHVTDTKRLRGMAFNVCENLRTMGQTTTLITHKESIFKERFIDTTHSHHILRVDHDEIPLPLELSHIEKLDIQAFNGTIISDYNKGYLTVPLLKKLLPLLPRPIYVDSKKRDLSIYENCIIKINENEFLTNKKLPQQHELVVTLGSRGALHQNQIYPAIKTNVCDICGAGDTFIAALCVANLSGYSMPDSIEFANVCAGISVRHSGVHAVTLDEVRNEIRILILMVQFAHPNRALITPLNPSNPGLKKLMNCTRKGIISLCLLHVA